MKITAPGNPEPTPHNLTVKVDEYPGTVILGLWQSAAEGETGSGQKFELGYLLNDPGGIIFMAKDEDGHTTETFLLTLGAAADAILSFDRHQEPEADDAGGN